MAGSISVSPISTTLAIKQSNGVEQKLTAEQRARMVQNILNRQNDAVNRLFAKVLEFYSNESKFAFTCLKTIPIDEIKKRGLVVPHCLYLQQLQLIPVF